MEITVRSGWKVIRAVEELSHREMSHLHQSCLWSYIKNNSKGKLLHFNIHVMLNVSIDINVPSNSLLNFVRVGALFILIILYGHSTSM